MLTSLVQGYPALLEVIR